jgi:hypothetical protein
MVSAQALSEEEALTQLPGCAMWWSASAVRSDRDAGRSPFPHSSTSGQFWKT